MSRFTKILLALTIVNLVVAALVVTDLVDASNVPCLYGTFPVGVTFMGTFLISLMLDKEVAAFDAEQIEKTRKVILLSTHESPEQPGRNPTHLDHAA